jgi:hypothetical protein
VNDSDAPANGEASNNAIEVVRNWRRCIDLEFIGEAQRGARSGLSDSFILSSTAESTATRRGRPSSSSKDFSSVVRHKVLKVTCFWVLCVCKISVIDLAVWGYQKRQYNVSNIRSRPQHYFTTDCPAMSACRRGEVDVRSRTGRLSWGQGRFKKDELLRPGMP